MSEEKGYKVTVTGGAHPILVDYYCNCGRWQRDVFFSRRADVTDRVPCECGEEAEKVIAVRRNFIHPSHSSLYGRYEPALDAVVEDYGHKKRLMDELGVMEGNDLVGGSREYRKDPPPKRSAGNDVAWTDDPGRTHP